MIANLIAHTSRSDGQSGFIGISQRVPRGGGFVGAWFRYYDLMLSSMLKCVGGVLREIRGRAVTSPEEFVCVCVVAVMVCKLPKEKL